MRFISAPFCALVLASLVVALPVSTSLLHLPSLLHDSPTHFLLQSHVHEVKRNVTWINDGDYKRDGDWIPDSDVKREQ
jgi:hypothetical protein